MVLCLSSPLDVKVHENKEHTVFEDFWVSLETWYLTGFNTRLQKHLHTWMKSKGMHTEISPLQDLPT